MSPDVVLIYDGECPFCNKFANLVELRTKIPSFSILNGRNNIPLLHSLLKKGYDLDNGAILIKGNDILHGASAISWICSEIKEPSDSLLELLRILFTSNKRTNFLFPFLLWGRRLSLTLKGKVWQPVSENIQYY